MSDQDQDDVLDILPIGQQVARPRKKTVAAKDEAAEAPRKRKVKKKAKRKVKRKKPVTPPLPPEPEEELDTLAEAGPDSEDDALETSEWDEASEWDALETEYESDDEDEDTDALDPMFDDLTKEEADAAAEGFAPPPEPEDDFEEGDYGGEETSEELQTLPIARDPAAPDASESPVAASEPREGQTLPDAVETLPGADMAVEAAPAEPQKPSEPEENVNRRWDEFLLALSDATRTAVWELGADSINWFRTRARGDLLPPRGKLTAGMVSEIETWLNQRGVFLAEKSLIGGSAMARAGSRGSTLKRGGIRVHQTKVPVVTQGGPETLGQSRNTRSSKRRFTM